MLENQPFAPAFVVGPMGDCLRVADLPPISTTRWTIRRKAEVVAAVNGRLLTLDEALERYRLTIEELVSWQRAVERYGLLGLRVTRLQHYRARYEKQSRY